MSAWTCRYTDGKADPKIVPPRPRIPYWKGLGADSEEKHEPVSDIDTAVVDSLKVLDPKRPIREADIAVQEIWTIAQRWARSPLSQVEASRSRQRKPNRTNSHRVHVSLRFWPERNAQKVRSRR